MDRRIEKALRGFLFVARHYGYAGEGEKKALPDGGIEFVFRSKEEGTFFYRDRYYGFNPFSGQELVWKDKKVIWTMNYYGGTASQEIIPEEIYDFLRKALRENREDSEPFYRGPRFYQEKVLTYLTEWQGNTWNFKGTEFVLHKGTPVYKGEYHGGAVKNKA